jgi:serine/threonine-protein kinase
LADFGIARWVNDISGLTATNMTVGTVSYAAPEQLMGARLDGRADQYALAATAFHLLTGAPPFQHSNPAVVISQHLSASPPAIGVRRPELSALDPVLAKALSKDPKDRFERCDDFARALAHGLDAAPTGDVGTTLAPAATPPKRSMLRAGIIVPTILAVLLIGAITVAITEFRRADRPEPTTATAKSPALRTPTFMPLPPPPEPAAPPAATSPAAPVAVIGAKCSPVGSTATTANGATAYCSTLQTTGASIWSLNPGDVPSPTVTTAPTEQPLPIAEESPVRVCMQQTGRTRIQCREEIRRSNLGLP